MSDIGLLGQADFPRVPAPGEGPSIVDQGKKDLQEVGRVWELVQELVEKKVITEVRNKSILITLGLKSVPGLGVVIDQLVTPDTLSSIGEYEDQDRIKRNEAVREEQRRLEAEAAAAMGEVLTDNFWARDP